MGVFAEDLVLGVGVRRGGGTGGGERMLGGEAENLTGGPTTRILPHVVCRIDLIVSRAAICECRNVA